FWNSTYDEVQFSDGTVDNAVTLKSGTGWARPVIALDGNGHAHVFFGEYGSRNINYSTNASGTWVNKVLSIEQSGEELAVGIDGSGRIHLIYMNYPEVELRHASLQL
ncbi:MAG TPA: hypothetical protein VLA34_11545, partial [Candidatus Krumholzibacterium sp.]|nr:hypothetical protein [Candidatus Krumholzibacterium sp.]